MNVVGKFGSLISQGVYSVATPFHPFGGAVDIIVVQQQDGSFRSTPWYVRFGKFQGVLKGAEKIVRISVNSSEADFHMYLDNSGEAYFVREAYPESGSGSTSGDVLKESGSSEVGDKFSNYVDRSNNMVGHRLEHRISDTGAIQSRDEFNSLGIGRIDRSGSDVDRRFYDFPDDESSQEDSVDLSEYESSRFENFDSDDLGESSSNSEVVLVSVDGHILMAPISESEQNNENVQLNTPQFHLGPGEGAEFCEENEDFDSAGNDWDGSYIREINASCSVGIVSAPGDGTGGTSGHLLEVCEGDRNHERSEDATSQVRESLNCEPKDATRTSGHLLEVSEGDAEREGPEDATGQVREPLNFDSEDASISVCIKREDVFKSCLELQELVNHYDAPLDTESNDSPCRIQIPREKFDQTSPAVDETGPISNCIEISKVDDISLSQSLGNSIQIDAVELIKEDSISTENMVSFKDSDRSDGFLEVEDGHHSTVVTTETTNESQTDPEVKTGMGENVEEPEVATESEPIENHTVPKIEISLCRSELHSSMGSAAAAEAFDARRVSIEEFQGSMASIVKNENLVVRYQGKYLLWEKAASLVLGVAAFGSDFAFDSKEALLVEEEEEDIPKVENESFGTPTSSSRRWRLWPIPFRRVKTVEHQNSSSSNENVFVDSEPSTQSLETEATTTSNNGDKSPRKQLIRTNIPTSEQIASLNLKEGQNMVTFSFSTRVLGKQQVDAHIYLWKWNARIVISDVDGTITKSDVLGQFMPLVGKDWTQSGVARLFSAIKENGYQLLFLSARAIVQAYLTRSFLLNLKQDGKALPNGPIVISPDGLFPSLYREVIRRAPHEFKIACLEDIKALFPSEYNPFYAGFGNRDTDELSYRKIGIPNGKIFIINPKGEVAISHRIDVRSYTSLHTLVNDMFPPTSLVEQEDYNSWNFWKMPLPDID
ncbi:hypothetical protein SAY87_024029 [Trapa incisa]|uniref:phosphatidate phosphatase n=1 Tax=Trapa incisa TaxID=236973 RepID=A0AAN7KTJ9_9MYRT|nr:hypothetical protein SAY87_024029 [Trapa incisa]